MRWDTPIAAANELPLARDMFSHLHCAPPDDTIIRYTTAFVGLLAPSAARLLVGLAGEVRQLL